MSGVDFQRLQQMAQQAQMPPMQRQPMQSVQNPIFGGSIPMNFGLPQASQIPADFQVRQFTPGKFNAKPKPDYSSVSDRAMNNGEPYYSGFGNEG